ncbi:MAG TPA: BON domain-containing protein [Blastocatellia bacterium]|nr:BON domain-containing protein [Blastocatellia bacterium]
MESNEQYLIGKVQRALATDPRVHKQDVTVTVCGSRIHISGQTSTNDRRRAIELVVSETVPEMEVRNELTVIEIAGPAQPEMIRD